MGTQQYYEEEPARRGLWTRMRERVFGLEEVEVVEDDSLPPPAPDARRRAALRLETARGGRVNIRLAATSFNDARAAADGLKSGQQQIVNLEKTPPAMVERIIDFLSGVTYALDGSVDKVGEKIYHFAPANVQIEVDDGSTQRDSTFTP